MRKSAMSDEVSIADAIMELRAQLERAERDGIGKNLRFLTTSVELELAVLFKNEREVGGGVKAWFVDISGKAKVGDETTNKVRLTLMPVGRDGKPALVSDDTLEAD
jgi:hypothetical protein